MPGARIFFGYLIVSMASWDVQPAKPGLILDRVSHEAPSQTFATVAQFAGHKLTAEVAPRLSLGQTQLR